MVIWRALLADGSVVSYDGSNSHEPLLDQIIEFQLVHQGAVVVRVQPDHGERVVYRRRNEGFNTWTTCHIVGLMSREHGLAFLTEYGEDGVLKIGMVPSIEFTPTELA